MQQRKGKPFTRAGRPTPIYLEPLPRSRLEAGGPVVLIDRRADRGGRAGAGKRRTSLPNPQRPCLVAGPGLRTETLPGPLLRHRLLSAELPAVSPATTSPACQVCPPHP